MPTYDYYCAENGQTLEVRHRMSESIHTWGELCERVGISPGDTPVDVPVSRQATGGNLVKSGSLKNPPAPPCGSPSPCGAGFCGHTH